LLKNYPKNIISFFPSFIFQSKFLKKIQQIMEGRTSGLKKENMKKLQNLYKFILNFPDTFVFSRTEDRCKTQNDKFVITPIICLAKIKKLHYKDDFAEVEERKRRINEFGIGFTQNRNLEELYLQISLEDDPILNNLSSCLQNLKVLKVKGPDYTDLQIPISTFNLLLQNNATLEYIEFAMFYFVYNEESEVEVLKSRLNGITKLRELRFLHYISNQEMGHDVQGALFDAILQSLRNHSYIEVVQIPLGYGMFDDEQFQLILTCPSLKRIYLTDFWTDESYQPITQLLKTKNNIKEIDVSILFGALDFMREINFVKFYTSDSVCNYTNCHHPTFCNEYKDLSEENVSFKLNQENVTEDTFFALCKLVELNSGTKKFTFSNLIFEDGKEKLSKHLVKSLAKSNSIRSLVLEDCDLEVASSIISTNHFRIQTLEILFRDSGIGNTGNLFLAIKQNKTILHLKLKGCSLCELAGDAFEKNQTITNLEIVIEDIFQSRKLAQALVSERKEVQIVSKTLLKKNFLQTFFLHLRKNKKLEKLKLLMYHNSDLDLINLLTIFFYTPRKVKVLKVGIMKSDAEYLSQFFELVKGQKQLSKIKFYDYYGDSRFNQTVHPFGRRLPFINIQLASISSIFAKPNNNDHEDSDE
jgi:hypothetical protein